MSVFLGQEGQHVVLDQQRQYGKAYPVPYQHFEDNNKSGIVNRQQNKSFLKDLALMLDVLQDLVLCIFTCSSVYVDGFVTPYSD
jgi:hypothetical protein